MPRTQEDIETFLLELGRSYELTGGTLVLPPRDPVPALAIRVQPPIVEVTVHIGAIPAPERKLALFEQLLRFNASELVHAAYAIEGDQIMLVSSLELENLDRNELEAVLAAIDIAVLGHLAKLRERAG